MDKIGVKFGVNGCEIRSELGVPFALGDGIVEGVAGG